MTNHRNRPPPLKQFYAVCFTVVAGEHEYLQTCWDAFEHRPTEAEQRQTAVREFFDKPSDIKLAIKQLKAYGYCWLPYGERILKNVGVEPHYRRIVEEASASARKQKRGRP